MKDNGGRAFPVPLDVRPTRDVPLQLQEGMSLRDYFAAKAMPSALAASSSSSGNYDYVAAAIGAYAVADAMLVERHKP